MCTRFVLVRKIGVLFNRLCVRLAAPEQKSTPCNDVMTHEN